MHISDKDMRLLTGQNWTLQVCQLKPYRKANIWSFDLLSYMPPMRHNLSQKGVKFLFLFSVYQCICMAQNILEMVLLVYFVIILLRQLHLPG